MLVNKAGPFLSFTSVGISKVLACCYQFCNLHGRMPMHAFVVVLL